MPIDNRVYCPECRQFVNYTVEKSVERIRVRNVDFSCELKHAFCDKCGSMIYVANINDENCDIREKAYRDAKTRQENFVG